MYKNGYKNKKKEYLEKYEAMILGGSSVLEIKLPADLLTDILLDYFTVDEYPGIIRSTFIKLKVQECVEKIPREYITIEELLEIIIKCSCSIDYVNMEDTSMCLSIHKKRIYTVFNKTLKFLIKILRENL